MYSERACPHFTSFLRFLNAPLKVLTVFLVKGADSLFPSPQSPRRWFSLFPPADPVCRIRPARSGKSWTCGGWRAAVSRSVHGQAPHRCGYKHKNQHRPQKNSQLKLKFLPRMQHTSHPLLQSRKVRWLIVNYLIKLKAGWLWFDRAHVQKSTINTEERKVRIE